MPLARPAAALVLATAAARAAARCLIQPDAKGHVVISPTPVHLSLSQADRNAIWDSAINAVQVPPGAFAGCSSLKSVTFSSSNAFYIEEGAFVACESLTTVTFEADYAVAIRIGKAAFARNPSLTSVSFGILLSMSWLAGSGSLYELHIGEGAFLQCSSLTSFSLPHGRNMTLGDAAFAECSALKSVSLGDGDGSYSAFNSQSLASIPMLAFYNCSSLTSVALPYSVESIGESAFSGCTALRSVRFLSTLLSGWGERTMMKTIGPGAFDECSQLRQIDLPNGLEAIGSVAFRNCVALTAIKIPGSVTTVGQWAFEGCTSLVSVTLEARGSHELGMGEDPFRNCSALECVKYVGGSYTRYPHGLSGSAVHVDTELVIDKTIGLPPSCPDSTVYEKGKGPSVSGYVSAIMATSFVAAILLAKLRSCICRRWKGVVAEAEQRRRLRDQVACASQSNFTPSNASQPSPFPRLEVQPTHPEEHDGTEPQTCQV